MRRSKNLQSTINSLESKGLEILNQLQMHQPIKANIAARTHFTNLIQQVKKGRRDIQDLEQFVRTQNQFLIDLLAHIETAHNLIKKLAKQASSKENEKLLLKVHTVHLNTLLIEGMTDPSQLGLLEAFIDGLNSNLQLNKLGPALGMDNVMLYLGTPFTTPSGTPAGTPEKPIRPHQNRNEEMKSTAARRLSFSEQPRISENNMFTIHLSPDLAVQSEQPSVELLELPAPPSPVIEPHDPERKPLQELTKEQSRCCTMM